LPDLAGHQTGDRLEGRDSALGDQCVEGGVAQKSIVDLT
jgi:hypothetical protein